MHKIIIPIFRKMGSEMKEKKEKKEKKDKKEKKEKKEKKHKDRDDEKKSKVPLVLDNVKSASLSSKTSERLPL